MIWRWIGLAAALACAALFFWPEPDEAPEPQPLVFEPAPVSEVAESTETEPAPEPEPEQPDLIAERAYELQLNGRRAGVLLVEWRWADHEGQRVIRDVTRTRTRTARMMGQVEDVFETTTQSTLHRTEDGDLLRAEESSVQGGREDRVVTRRTETGYEVTVSVNGNEEVFGIETPGPTKVDAEAFLGPRIRSGEAKPGSTFEYRVLATGRRTSLPAVARVEEYDDTGPGLRVRVTIEGHDSLWWFAPDGSVMRMHAGDSVVRRADDLTFDDLPFRPASYRITLPSNIDLPRIFTARTIEVDLDVRTTDTVRPPKIPANPYTEVVEETDSGVRLRLKAHDAPGVNAKLPIDPKGFEEFLKATPDMEVDDPELRGIATRIAAEHDDARATAKALAAFVFETLHKGSSETASPTAKQILADGGGDCSEHALLFTALCRAAGIPARRCSGFVCLGPEWGAHAWCEIWVGAWIGADPTTNEVGTRARYIFCGRDDDRDTAHASINADRSRIRIRSAEFDDGVLDFEDLTTMDRAVFTGIRLADLPEGWRVMDEARFAPYRSFGSEQVRLDVCVQPDHGYRSLDVLLRQGDSRFQRTKFGGRDAIVRKMRRNTSWVVPLGRQNLWVNATAIGAIPVGEIEAALKPTLDRDDG